MKQKTANAEPGYYKPGDRITIKLNAETAPAANLMRASWCSAMGLDVNNCTNNWPPDATVLGYALLRARHAA